MPKKKRQRRMSSAELVKRVAEVEDEAKEDEAVLFWADVFAGLGLRGKHKQFVREYLTNDMNGTRAYMAAYDVKSEDVASSCATRLLKSARIQRALDRALYTNSITPERVMAEIMELGRNAEHEKNRLRALELAARAKGVFNKENRRDTNVHIEEFAVDWKPIDNDDS